MTEGGSLAPGSSLLPSFGVAELGDPARPSRAVADSAQLTGLEGDVPTVSPSLDPWLLSTAEQWSWPSPTSLTGVKYKRRKRSKHFSFPRMS